MDVVERASGQIFRDKFEDADNVSIVVNNKIRFSGFGTGMLDVPLDHCLDIIEMMKEAHQAGLRGEALHVTKVELEE